VSPQQPVPAAIASALAVGPQQDPAAAASAAVPQHGVAAAADRAAGDSAFTGYLLSNASVCPDIVLIGVEVFSTLHAS
jgi:hypothetical protein